MAREVSRLALVKPEDRTSELNSQPGAQARARGRALLAALFALLWPGVGQLYNENWRKAALFMMGAPLVTALAQVLVVTVPVPRVNLLPILLPLGLQLAAIVDAVREARRPRADGRPWYSRWYTCAALILFNMFLWLPVQLAALHTSVVQAFYIPTGGMEPTVQIGDYVYASKFTYAVRNPITGTLA
jgi:hypothetical protein